MARVRVSFVSRDARCRGAGERERKRKREREREHRAGGYAKS